MKRYNILVIFSPEKDRVLMCRRRKPPYAGLLNFVGGKIEAGESDETAAYRELWEETSVTRDDVQLLHLMDLCYPMENDCFCQVWVGRLTHLVNVKGEENDLFWIDTAQDFSDVTRFAGRGNIYHMMQYIRMGGILDGERGIPQ